MRVRVKITALRNNLLLLPQEFFFTYFSEKDLENDKTTPLFKRIDNTD